MTVAEPTRAHELPAWERLEEQAAKAGGLRLAESLRADGPAAAGSRGGGSLTMTPPLPPASIRR